MVVSMSQGGTLVKHASMSGEAIIVARSAGTLLTDIIINAEAGRSYLQHCSGYNPERLLSSGNICRCSGSGSSATRSCGVHRCRNAYGRLAGNADKAIADARDDRLLRKKRRGLASGARHDNAHKPCLAEQCRPGAAAQQRGACRACTDLHSRCAWIPI